MACEARFYERQGEGRLTCRLCPHACSLEAGQTGRCGVRVNRGGVLEARAYGEISAFGLDPVEKKPLYHFYPGSAIFSVGSYGCNLACDFCQNHRIAHGRPRTLHLEPQQLVEAAAEESASIGVAFTYNEPVINIEYILDCAELLRRRGMKVVLVTNGFIEEEPLEILAEAVDAMNIDLKAFHEGFYSEVCRGGLAPVKRTIRRASRSVHLEVTTLLIEGLNTDPGEIRDLSRFLADLGPDIPLHLSRYFPAWKRTDPPTSPALMGELAETAREHLNHVYLGNVAGFDNNTYCPDCGALLVERHAYQAFVRTLKAERCGRCGRKIYIRQ